MTTTPQAALAAAQAYVKRNRPECRVVGLDHDDRDYLVRLELVDGLDEWPLGPGPILVSKTTGRIHTMGSYAGGDPRWSAMTPVAIEET